MNTVTTSLLPEWPVSQLKGVGPKIHEHLARLGIHTLQDLLLHLPLRYQDRTRVLPIRSVKIGDSVLIEGYVTQARIIRTRRSQLLCRLQDKTSGILLRFFHFNAAQLKTFQQTSLRIRCFGEIHQGSSCLEMIHPEYQLFEEDSPPPLSHSLTPVYPLVKGLSQSLLRKLMQQALTLLQQVHFLPDELPEEIMTSLQFVTLEEALIYIHQPPVDADTEALMLGKHPMQQRLVFEELLAHHSYLARLKLHHQHQRAHSLANDKTPDEWISTLPFSLTTAQKRVWKEIKSDLKNPYPMMRLVQGDVGSGKTLVAMLSALQAAASDFQVALMAPTELLAEQHYRTFKKLLSEHFPLETVALLTGSLSSSERQQTLDNIAIHQSKIIIGTHALFQSHVHFPKLALIIIDEQHRFGVHQRFLLKAKGETGTVYPHQLIMTATPIPRTLAMTLYADLQYSLIDEMPPGRQPINTVLMGNEKREALIARLKEHCLKGEQAYWVCSLIEDSETLEAQAAEKTAELLKKHLPMLKIGLLHGRVKSAEKELLMNTFLKGDLHVLVATTVIEVGMDVPNATLIIIENAERYGLSQLHQLRGRVGRGEKMSHCVLLYRKPLSPLAHKRLHYVRECHDGFRLSEWDLELRGAGDILGIQQTGGQSFKLANLVRDVHCLPQVQALSQQLQISYPQVIHRLAQRWLKIKPHYVQV